MSTLEILRDVEATLSGEEPDYEYSDWGKCACGHIYTAARATSDRATLDETFQPADAGATYPNVIIATAIALGWDGKPNAVALQCDLKQPVWEHATDYVSDLTGDRMNDVHLSDNDPTIALTVIREAIAKIEENEEADRRLLAEEACPVLA